MVVVVVMMMMMTTTMMSYNLKNHHFIPARQGYRCNAYTSDSGWAIHPSVVIRRLNKTRRLANAKRLRVSICVTKKLARVNWPAFFSVIYSLCKISLLWVIRWAHVWDPKKFRVLESHTLGINIMPDHVETRPSPTLYHTEFGRSRLNDVGVGNGPKKIWGRWGPAPLGCGVADP